VEDTKYGPFGIELLTTTASEKALDHTSSVEKLSVDVPSVLTIEIAAYPPGCMAEAIEAGTSIVPAGVGGE
jgi:hypothetical protein